MRRVRTIRYFRSIGIVLGLSGLALLGSLLWPTPQRSQAFILSPEHLQALAGESIRLPLELGVLYRLEMRSPTWVRLGEQGEITFTLAKADLTEAPDLVDRAEDASNVLVEASLQGGGLAIQPGETFQAPVAGENPLTLRWRVSASQAGKYPVKLWVHLLLVNQQDTGVVRIPVAEFSLPLSAWGLFRWQRSALLAAGLSSLISGALLWFVPVINTTRVQMQHK